MPRSIFQRTALPLLLIGLSALPALAQSDRATRFMDDCRRNRSDDKQFCETREVTLRANKALTVDGRDNGGISVHAWDKAEIRVVALIQARAESESAAREIAKQITITSSGADVHASGPRQQRHESWSVSYEISAPATTELTLDARNGGIAVEGMNSRMRLGTMNGGLHLTNVDGDVRGTTVNGGIVAELSGNVWRGTGLDLTTVNGGVHLSIPANYSAQLETGTVNGGMDIGFPVTVQGQLHRQLTTQLGSGGPTIRAVTTNGGVSIRRR